MEIALDESPSIDVVRTLFAEYAASLGFSLEFQDFAGELATLPGFYAPPAGALLTATVDGTAAGCVGVRPLDDEGSCELKRLYVRPAYRSLGLGRLLTERAVAAARARGYARMRLDTAPGLERAHALYEKLGFVEIPAYTANPVPGVRFLELELGAA